MRLSSSPAVEVSGLGKRYPSSTGDRWAVRGLDLTVPLGSIYGLLGRNGAGKTTALRCLTGLARPNEGRIEIFGAVCPDDLPSVIGRVGAFIEGPSLDPSMSARSNLRILARLRRIPTLRVDEVLEVVGLCPRADDSPSSYSLGMRHRLGLAAALLGDPDLLILDEPTNGLDPAGIADVRALLRRLNTERGTTVVLSSHQLGEVGALCDRVAILDHGSIRAEGTPQSLAGGSAGDVLEAAFLELTDD